MSVGVRTGYLSDNINITSVSGHSTAAASNVTGTGVDMADYTGVLFVAKFGTAASDNTLKAQSSTDDGSADAYADLEGTLVGVASSDEVVFLDITNPRERYVRPIGMRGTSSTLEGIWAFRYGKRSLPEDNTTAGTIHGEQHNSPAEGTA